VGCFPKHIAQTVFVVVHKIFGKHNTYFLNIQNKLSILFTNTSLDYPYNIEFLPDTQMS